MTALRPISYLNPKLEARIKKHSSHMYGVFAAQPVSKGELLTIWGGDVVDFNTFMTLDEYLRELSIQIEDNFFLVPLTLGPADYFNHSCNPNAGLSGQISLVALRDIPPGEEVRFDYAMSDSTDYDEFKCECGEANCRGRFTGKDWQLPALWERYGNYFSPYLLRHIEELKQEQSRQKAETQA
jgi:hypothetical protein